LRASLEHVGHASNRCLVAVPGYDAAILVFDFAAPIGKLLHEHHDGLQNVERFETGDGYGGAVVARDELVGCAADDGRDMAGPDKRVEAHFRRIEKRTHGRDDCDVVAEDGEVLDSFALCPLNCERGRRSRRLEADGEKDHLAVGIFAGNAESVERRIDHADIRALRFDFEQAAFRAGDTHHVAEAGEDDLRAFRDRDAVVDAPHRQDAHRASWAVNELDLFGQHVFDAVAIDCMCMAAAHLHDFIVALAVCEMGDFARDGPR
jgi:hypothetical protein